MSCCTVQDDVRHTDLLRYMDRHVYKGRTLPSRSKRVTLGKGPAMQEPHKVLKAEAQEGAIEAGRKKIGGALATASAKQVSEWKPTGRPLCWAPLLPADVEPWCPSRLAACQAQLMLHSQPAQGMARKMFDFTQAGSAGLRLLRQKMQPRPAPAAEQTEAPQHRDDDDDISVMTLNSAASGGSDRAASPRAAAHQWTGSGPASPRQALEKAAGPIVANVRGLLKKPAALLLPGRKRRRSRRASSLLLARAPQPAEPLVEQDEVVAFDERDG